MNPPSSDQIFAAALECDAAGRDAFLARACGGDAALLAMVRRLIAAHESMPAGFLAGALGDEAAAPESQTILMDTRASVQTGAAATSGANPDAPVPFVFGERIAQGGMGAILEADDCKLGRKIAVKVMLLDQEPDEQQKQRFVQEAAVLGRLEHPNIVPVHDLGRDSESQLYYTMKLVHGRTLQDILDDLRAEQPEALRGYTLDRLLTIFRKVCDAIAFAHSRSIIHRDLKPENVMVGEFGEVLVMDWGIAKILGGGAEMPGCEGTIESASNTGSFTATMQGAVMGTPKYMSPEQAMGRIDELDARSDIFSLGGILYAILTLRPPVEGATLEEVLQKVVSGKIEPLGRVGVPPAVARVPRGTPEEDCAAQSPTDASNRRSVPRDADRGGRDAHPTRHIPDSLAAVAMKALALDKARRYQDVAAFSADIEAYQNGFATTAEHAGLGKQLVLLIKRHKGIFSTAAAAWLLITALAVWFVFNLRAKERRATKAEAIAVQEKETARQALAKSQLDLAEKEFERGKFVEAEKILEETPESFRDANWRFLHAHSRDFTAQLSLPGKGSVYQLRLLLQGDRFAARCHAGAVGIFTTSGRQIGSWFPVAKGWGTFGINRAGSRLALPASASEVAVYDVAAGEPLQRWTCEISEIKHVLLSPDGGTVLAAGGKPLIAYAAQTGAPLWTQPFNDVIPAFSPDGRTVAVVVYKYGLALKVQLLDTLTGAVRGTLEATADNPIKVTLQFNQAGDRLACLGGDEVIIWNPKTAAKVRALHFPGETVKRLSPDGSAVATISGSRIRLWDTTTGRLLRSLNGAATEAFELAFSFDGKILLSSHAAAHQGIVHIWPTRLGEEITSSRITTSQTRRVLFSSDASSFYACVETEATAWDVQSGLRKRTFSDKASVLRDMAIHPTDGSIILSEFDKPAFTHVSSNGEALAAFGAIDRSSVKFNRNGQLLLAVNGAFDRVTPGSGFSVTEYSSGKVLRTIWFEKPGQPSAAFCLDDAAVATAALAGGITVWDWKAGTPQRQIAATETGSIACLASSPDGRHLASGGPDRWIRVWAAATGRLEAAFRAHWEGVSCVKFSPDGREILSGSEDGTVRLHDAATGEERLAFYGLNTPVVDVDISGDGKRIAAITIDGFSKVWDRQHSSEAARLPIRPAPKQPAVANAADGWEDLLARLTPDEVEKTGHGWSLEGGVLFSPDTQFATLPLPGKVSGTSYRVRVELQQLPAKGVFHIVLPVADRMCGFEFEGRPHGGIYTGLMLVNGKYGKDLPGIVEGKQVNDTDLHDLEVTVRLDGANATITATLDTRPLYEWTGPTNALSRIKAWDTTEPGALALGTYAGGWAVSEVKVKRLEK